MTKGLTLWNDFAFEMLRELRGMSPEKRREFWGTPKDRTEFYLALDYGMIPKVAKRMGMRFVREYMRIDGVLFPENGFPQVFVESENDPTGIADSEIEKLCYVRAPLKVVVTVSRWPDESRRSRWLQDIKDCQQKWLTESPEVLYGFIIGEAKREDTGPGKRLGLTFHLFGASPDGEIVDTRPPEVVGWFPEIPAALAAETV